MRASPPTHTTHAHHRYARILDVVSRYAIHNGGRGISFVCKKAGSGPPDLHTPASASSLDNIGTVFGAEVARELVPLAVEAAADAAAAGGLCAAVTGYVSKPTYAAKKGVLVLFINGRLVECGSLKRAVDAAYAPLLPKGAHAFAYMDIRMPSEHVDVNVHPTKREVRSPAAPAPPSVCAVAS